MFKIGNVEIKGRVVCAPMAGVTNQIFRTIAASSGAALTYTEMTSNVGLKYNGAKTLEIAHIDKSEYPVAIQIFGGSVEDYVEAAKYYDKNSNAAIIDINMGCPVNKVAIKSQAGSSLLKDPQKIETIIREIKKVITKPLTIKIRIGWDNNDLTYLEVARRAEAAGVDAIAVHGRTRSQLYSGKANWDAIKQIKELVKIPVIGNGDVVTPEDAKRMLDETGVDAVMVARSAESNPWIFKQINEYLNNGSYSKYLSKNEVIDEIINYYHNLSNLKNEKVALSQIRGVMTRWLARFNELKQARNILIQHPTWEDISKHLLSLKD